MEDVEAEVAATLAPLIVLLGRDRTNELDQRTSAGEDADDIGAASDLPSGTFLGVVGPGLTPGPFGEAGEREHVRACASQVLGRFRQFLLKCVQPPVGLGVNGVRVGLVVRGDRPAPMALPLGPWKLCNRRRRRSPSLRPRTASPGRWDLLGQRHGRELLRESSTTVASRSGSRTATTAAGTPRSGTSHH